MMGLYFILIGQMACNSVDFSVTMTLCFAIWLFGYSCYYGMVSTLYTLVALLLNWRMADWLDGGCLMHIVIFD